MKATKPQLSIFPTEEKEIPDVSKMQSKIRKAALDYLKENKTILNQILP